MLGVPAALAASRALSSLLYEVQPTNPSILAAVAARGRALVPLGVALAASLLLCTIDHFPSHYFLPLVHLSAAALAAAAPGRRGDVAVALGVVGLWITATWMPVL